MIIKGVLFQSPHPVWGGTIASTVGASSSRYFNPPTPCGVGLRSVYSCSIHPDFDPPTPCGVGRAFPLRVSTLFQFQSTHPVWGGTGVLAVFASAVRISIHPPRVGWDSICITPSLPGYHFNPPTPCGVGRRHPSGVRPQDDISIHPPRVGWDHVSHQCGSGDFDFNPPTPCGVGLQ